MAVFKKIIIGNDHAGYEAKKHVIDYLEAHGIDYIDIGTYSTDIVRYPYYASRVGKAVASHDQGVDGGILICGTGVGVSIAANKVKGIRASLCTDSTIAELTRAHNNSNVLCLGGKIIGQFVIDDILDKWLNTEFMGMRHYISVKMLEQIEEVNYTGETFIPDPDWVPDDYNGPLGDN